ncbi:MAG: hypothetical protein ACE5H8_07080 [Alphaproteobacteria bacterium]
MSRTRNPRLAFRRPRSALFLAIRVTRRMRRAPKRFPLPRRRLPIVERRFRTLEFGAPGLPS